MCFIFHKWSKWKQYKREMTIIPGRLSPKIVQGKKYTSIENWQKRKCKKCDYTQEKEVDSY